MRRRRGRPDRRYKATVGEALSGKNFRHDLATKIKELGAEHVAELTGRTLRSVKRWLTGKTKPRADAASKLQAASENYRKTREWRQRQIPVSRERRLRSKGGTIHMNALCGPENDSPGASIRERRFSCELSPEAMSALIDGWLNNGEAGAREALDDVLYWEYIHQQQYRTGAQEKNWGFRTDALYGVEINHYHEY